VIGRGLALVLSAALIAACGAARLMTVPSGPPPPSAQPVAVDYPPPAAQIEEIPLSRKSNSGCVWRDGYWDWTGRRWEWQAGRAVLPPKGCLFASPKLEWTTDFLSFYRPAWYPDPTLKPAPKACLEVACIPAAGSAPPEAE
jgi:hypothetical protein